MSMKAPLHGTDISKGVMTPIDVSTLEHHESTAVMHHKIGSPSDSNNLNRISNLKWPISAQTVLLIPNTSP